MNLENNTILITGGASGIGIGLAERFIKTNNTVIICGRREDALMEAKIKLPSLHTFQCDLASVSEREKLFHYISTQHTSTNVLINNAGIQNWMQITDTDFMQRAKEEIAINIEAPLHLTSLFISMSSLTTIMNVSSGLSFSPLVKTPVYSATKAFLHSFTLSLRSLLKNRKIEVIEIIPPALNTDLGGKGLHDYAPAVRDFIDSIFLQLKDGKDQLTFGFSEAMVNAGPEELKMAFLRMNESQN